MSDIAIKVEHLSKMYRLGVINNGTLYKDIQTWLALKMGKEDPHSKIGQNKYSGDKDHFWALKDVSFDIKKGERVGIIGKNGAGKSTLLKILSRITLPTEGVIKIKGRTASLLEVGTGFHHELTGKENIYLNGAILGMKKRRISQKLDEIIAFSGIEHHIDTPVKRYSSGMYVRLAFAVAAHLDSDILIADEVLAVGDAEFQKKALGKMQDLSTGEGRTVLFVSHNITAIKNLCTKGIVLQEGSVSFQGDIGDAIDFYTSKQEDLQNNYWDFENAPGVGNIRIKSAHIEHEGEKLTVKKPFKIIAEFWCLKENFEISVSIHVYNSSNECIFAIGTKYEALSKGLHKAIFNIPANLMNNNSYYVNYIYVVNHSTWYFTHNQANSFVIEEERDTTSWHGKWIGAVRPNGFITCEVE